MSTICNQPKTNNSQPNYVKPKTSQQNNKNQQQQEFLMNKMHDGRAFTDYRPRCTVQFQMKNETSKNSFESRQFLMNNAEKLMQANEDIVKNNYENLTKANGTMLPEKHTVKCDSKTCNTNHNVYPNGIGTGRSY